MRARLLAVVRVTVCATGPAVWWCGAEGSPAGYVDGACSGAAFGSVTGLAYADQRLFVADGVNNAVRVVHMHPYAGPSGAWVALRRR